MCQMLPCNVLGPAHPGLPGVGLGEVELGQGEPVAHHHLDQGDKPKKINTIFYLRLGRKLLVSCINVAMAALHQLSGQTPWQPSNSLLLQPAGYLTSRGKKNF